MANYFEDNAFFAGLHFQGPFYQENDFFKEPFFGDAFTPVPEGATVAKKAKPRKKKVVKDGTDSRDK